MTRAGFIRGSFAALMVMAMGFVTGCEDEDEPEPFFLRFTMNGTQTVAYTDQTALEASFVTTGSQRSATFTGHDANTSITLEALDGVNIIEDFYDGYWDIGTHIFGSLITYVDGDAVTYSSATDNSSDAIITITDLSATTVRGTFSGTLKAEGHPDITISGGQFFVVRAAP